MLVIIGDPFYSSLAHLIRIIRVFELCKQVEKTKVEAHLFVHADDVVGRQVKQLIRDAVEKGIVDKVIPVPTVSGNYFDLNRAKTLATYIKQNKNLLLHELRHKGKHINSVAANTEQVIVFSSPGFLGGWYVSPFVLPNVKNVLILDTTFHPKSEVHFGTAWKTQSFKGKSQTLLLQLKLYKPFLRVIGEVRSELGLRPNKTREALYDNLPIIDPNVPSYMKLKGMVKDHHSIGPLVLSHGEPTLEQVQTLQEFKDGKKLVYITLGGSVKTPRFALFIRKVVEGIVKKTTNEVRFIVTSGSVVDPDEVVKALGTYAAICSVYSFYNAKLLTSIANVAIGVMGQGHILLAAQNGCPLVMCPINADQVTHANLVVRLGLGESPLSVKPHEMFHSERLIEKVLGNADCIVLSAVKILHQDRIYLNENIQFELNNCDQNYQEKVITSLITQV